MTARQLVPANHGFTVEGEFIGPRITDSDAIRAFVSAGYLPAFRYVDLARSVIDGEFVEVAGRLPTHWQELPGEPT